MKKGTAECLAAANTTQVMGHRSQVTVQNLNFLHHLTVQKAHVKHTKWSTFLCSIWLKTGDFDAWTSNKKVSVFLEK